MAIVSLLLLVARLLLAGVFALAGVAKLFDPAGSRRSLADFGVPQPLIAIASIALPIVEIAVALALLAQSTAAYGAVAALVLLALFIGGITLNLARGRAPDCHCFGQIHSKPIGWPALGRNAALAATAVFVASAGWRDAGPSLAVAVIGLTRAEDATRAGIVAIFTVLGSLTLLLAGLVRQNTRLRQQVTAFVAATGATAKEGSQPATYATATSGAGSSAGAVAPSFSLPALAGGTVSLHDLLGRGRPLLLFFSDPDCGPCRVLSPDIARWQEQYKNTLTVAVISRGTQDANQKKLGLLHVENVLLQRNREVALMYGAFGTPAAILVQRDGTLGSAATIGDWDIRKLVERASQEPLLVPAGPPAPPAPTASPAVASSGEPAPTADTGLIPHDLDGRPVTLDELIHQPTLLLFWSPGCVFCRRMLADVKDWEAKPLTERPQLLLLSSGSIEENRAYGLISTIIIDEMFVYGKRYGAIGTPAAVLVDAHGQATTDTVVSAPAIFALVGHEVPPRDTAEEEPADIAATTLEPLLMTLPEGARPLKEGCVHDELLSDGSMILYNGCRHRALTINPTAALVWEYCDGAFDVDGIITELRAVFPEVTSIDADVRQIMDNLVQAGMITPAASQDRARSVQGAAISGAS